MKSTSLLTAAIAALANVELVSAHTFIWGVWVNGVDQGTNVGIRSPAYNAAPPRGYNNSPVKNLTSIDMRCNVLGDNPNPYTIKVKPGDNLTFDWHHNNRTKADDVIDFSHHGPILAYISPDPPTENSFVKIFEKGLYELPEKEFAPGKWAISTELKSGFGIMNVRVPAGLKAGPYLIRGELIALHEADASYEINPRRGAQFYPNCVQIEVEGDGTVELPSGVSFPGAYKYGEPGIVHNVYCSTETTSLKEPCTTTYPIPGGTVWSGAWAETTKVELGPVKGVVTHTPWSSWIVSSVVTTATYAPGNASPTILGSSSYEPKWSSVYSAPTAPPTVTAPPQV